MQETRERDPTRLESLNIINALRRGTVPASGLSRIAVGLSLEEDVIAKQLDYVAQGGGDLKFIRGDYGSGKTFLVARALEIARQKGFVTTRVIISPSTPLSRFKAVYQQICTNFQTKTEEHAVKSIIDTWLFSIEERLLSISGPEGEENEALESATIKEIETALIGISEVNSALAAALRTYYQASNSGDFQMAQAALGWISGEPNIGRTFKQKAGVKGDIDETVAFAFLQGLVRILKGAGYQGLVIAFDELETTQTLPKASRDKGYHLILQLTDSLDSGTMPGCFLLFTGTPSFFDGSRGIRSLPPLYDRINVEQSGAFRNLRQPQIQLPKFDTAKLEQVALKVADIYSLAHAPVDRERISHRFIRAMIRKITTRFGGRVDVIPRIFLKEFIDVLDKCEIYQEFNPWDAYEFETGHLEGDLKEEEEAVMVMQF